MESLWITSQFVMWEQFFVAAQENNELLECEEANATRARIYSTRYWHEVDPFSYSKLLIYYAQKTCEYTEDAADPTGRLSASLCSWLLQRFLIYSFTVF